jgi:hypothetical protein
VEEGETATRNSRKDTQKSTEHLYLLPSFAVVLELVGQVAKKTPTLRIKGQRLQIRKRRGKKSNLIKTVMAA